MDDRVWPHRRDDLMRSGEQVIEEHHLTQWKGLYLAEDIEFHSPLQSRSISGIDIRTHMLHIGKVKVSLRLTT